MPRARDGAERLDPALAHLLATGCDRHDEPGDPLAVFELTHPYDPTDLSPLRALWTHHADEIRAAAGRTPWVALVLDGRIARARVRCAAHRDQAARELRSALARLDAAEAAALEAARKAELAGPTTHCVTATVQMFAEQRWWLRRELSALDGEDGEDTDA